MARFTRLDAVVAMGVLAVACSRPQQAEMETAGADSATLAAAGADAPLQVASVMIGKRIGQGNRVTEPTFQFSPQDTVHVSVATEGTGTGTLTAAWRSQGGEIVQKTSEQAHAAGENTAFSLAQPKGLKRGTYKVVVFLDNDSVETKVFVVGK